MDGTDINIMAPMMSHQQQKMQAARQNLQHAEDQNMAAIEHAAQEFEAVFVSEMLKPMFEGIKTDPMFGGGQAEKTYKSMMMQEYGKSIAAAGGIGIADHVKAELIRIQQLQAK